MAACLLCGFAHAKVLYSRTVHVDTLREDGVRVLEYRCWRTVRCPACGSKRGQEIHDTGESRRTWIPPGEKKASSS